MSKISKEAYLSLLLKADEARAQSYSPYSNKSVGAALLCASGKIYTGANIESASFSPTVCAERVAFFSAVHAKERDFEAIAVSGGDVGQPAQDKFHPCGVCRQVMAEFCDDDFKIIVGTKDNAEEYTLAEILPLRFGKAEMGTE